ncbi:pitrilysin family protein [Longimicrobium sp.]|uniref:M16 family metallopeptidase n=1 Tax=Longimicrobium sp. TaxID=2029185 RepID=UPI002B8DB4A1|nr:pitrilysin family protein [Longimicrobium sp.]HSU13115.1 pitrilysin family protein [Longimicrobium sp.]
MKRLVLALPLAALLPAALAAQTAISYTEETLPNGLKVIYHVDHSTPVAAVDIWYNVGSKNEAPGRTGFAHLFEHMMFKGSRNVADGQHFALLEGAGARAGADINGTTAWDRTNYFEQLPSNQLELALWLEADRMGTLADVLTQEKLDNQREVVKNERRQSYDNQPYGTWTEKMEGLVFPEGHPYHHDVIGSMEDLSAASLEDVRNFFRTYYAPNNAVLVVAGDIDVTQAKALVRKHFAAIPRHDPPPALRDATLPAVVGREQREVVQDANAPVPAVFIGFRVPPQRAANAAAVDLLSSMLSGRSGPLYESLVRRQGVATNAAVFNFDLLEGADILVVNANGKPGANADSLEAAVKRELDNVMAGLTQENLDRARAQARYQLVNGLQRTGGFGGRADMLAEGWTYFRDPNYVNTRVAALDRVTLADVRAIARERLVPSNRVTLVYVPNRAPAGAQPQTPGSR